jgi:hypothetical protein
MPAPLALAQCAHWKFAELLAGSGNSPCGQWKFTDVIGDREGS